VGEKASLPLGILICIVLVGSEKQNYKLKNQNLKNNNNNACKAILSIATFFTDVLDNQFVKKLC